METGEEEEIVFAESMTGGYETTTAAGNNSVAISVGSEQREVVSSHGTGSIGPKTKSSISKASSPMSVNADEFDFED